MIRFIASIVLAGGAILLPACAAPPRTADSPDAGFAPGIQTAAALKFEDVPVPNGFAYVADRSTVMEAGAFRSGVLVYQGNAPQEEVVAYYLQEMTKYDWRPVSKVEDRGRTALFFEKPGLVCQVEVSTWGRRASTVKVTYVPKGPARSS